MHFIISLLLLLKADSEHRRVSVYQRFIYIQCVLVKTVPLLEALQLLMVSVKMLMYLEPKLFFLTMLYNFYVFINKMSMSFSIIYVYSLYISSHDIMVVMITPIECILSKIYFFIYINSAIRITI